jgi:hypothetical protein
MSDDAAYEDPSDDLEVLNPEEQKILDKLVKEDPDDIDVDEVNYKWDEEFQRHILGMLLNDEHFLMQSLPLIEPEYFTNEVHKMTCRKLFKHFDDYKARPEKPFLIQEIENAVKDRDEKTKWRFVTETRTVYDFYVPGIDSREYLLDKITNFAKIQALRTAFSRCLDMLKKNPDDDDTWSKIDDVLNEARQKDRSYELGLEYFKDPEERYQKKKNVIKKCKRK